MATVLTPGISESEYLRSAFHPDCEYVDGGILQRSLGEHDHSLLQTLIIPALGERHRSGKFRARSPNNEFVWPRAAIASPMSA